uniref:Serine type protease n=1 Tax=Culicoides sonorensis TaxID=179676 RepID=Q5QBH0_CULSO|nr:serine type protease [Culicoides sonorensis]
MSQLILFSLLVACASAAVTQVPIAKPVFPEDAHRPSRTSRIVNGFPASVGQFPHQVRMLARISSTQNSVCGASIISDTFVLTAAHCTRGFNSFELGFGSIDFNNPQYSLTSSKKLEHSGYNPTNLNNDIALIELPVRLQWTKTVSPIQLPSYSQASMTFIGRQATASGFGKTKDENTQVSNLLMYVYTRIIGNSECSALYGTDIVRAFTLCTRGWG